MLNFSLDKISIICFVFFLFLQKANMVLIWYICMYSRFPVTYCSWRRNVKPKYRNFVYRNSAACHIRTRTIDMYALQTYLEAALCLAACGVVPIPIKVRCPTFKETLYIVLSPLVLCKKLNFKEIHQHLNLRSQLLNRSCYLCTLSYCSICRSSWNSRELKVIFFGKIRKIDLRLVGVFKRSLGKLGERCLRKVKDIAVKIENILIATQIWLLREEKF